MGSKLSKTSIQPFLLKYVGEFSYERTLNKSYLYNTVLADVENEGPIVCKMVFAKDKAYITSLYEAIEVEIERLQEIFHIHSSPNILPYHSCMMKKNCILILRQFMYQDLRKKINQKCELIEKKWLTFQLLNAVSQLHSKAITHGDIKPENIVLTSFNWLFLTDFLTLDNVYEVNPSKDTEQYMLNYKPTYVKEDVWNIYNMFFGDFDNNKRCYIAPERCLNNLEYMQKTVGDYMVQPQMDIFSLGCVIAEIFLDGKPLFDLARHQLYRKGKFNPKDILCLIGDEDIEDLILDMISLDPQNRQSIDVYRQQWIDKVFPQSFKCILFQLGSSMMRENIIFSDERIAMIRKYLDAVWISCYGEELSPMDLLAPTPPKIFEYLKFENFPNIITDLFPDYDCIIQHKNNGERHIGNVEFKNEKQQNLANDSSLVLVTMIGTFCMSARYPDTKMVAIEMLKCIGRQIRTEFRLQYVVPYLISHFQDPICKVRLAAVDSVIEVLKDCESIEIGHTDYYVFDTYLFPAFLKLLEDDEEVIRLKFTETLPYLVNIGKMFIASVNLHKQTITMLAKEDQNAPEIDQEEREQLLFASLGNEEEVPVDLDHSYKLVRKHMDEEDDDSEPKVDPTTTTTAEGEGEGEGDVNQTDSQPNLEEAKLKESEDAKSKADEDEKSKHEFVQSLLDDNNIISWSRKRFITDEQKVRSIVGIGYNMSLNDNDSDLSDDPEQEDEVEREIDKLRERIFEVVEKTIMST